MPFPPSVTIFSLKSTEFILTNICNNIPIPIDEILIEDLYIYIHILCKGKGSHERGTVAKGPGPADDHLQLNPKDLSTLKKWNLEWNDLVSLRFAYIS